MASASAGNTCGFEGPNVSLGLYHPRRCWCPSDPYTEAEWEPHQWASDSPEENSRRGLCVHPWVCSWRLPVSCRAFPWPRESLLKPCWCYRFPVSALFFSAPSLIHFQVRGKVRLFLTGKERPAVCPVCRYPPVLRTVPSLGRTGGVLPTRYGLSATLGFNESVAVVEENVHHLFCHHGRVSCLEVCVTCLAETPSFFARCECASSLGSSYAPNCHPTTCPSQVAFLKQGSAEATWHKRLDIGGAVQQASISAGRLCSGEHSDSGSNSSTTLEQW